MTELSPEARQWLNDMDMKLVHCSALLADGSPLLSVLNFSTLDLYNSHGLIILSLTYDTRELITPLIDTEEATEILFNSELVQLRERIQKQREEGAKTRTFGSSGLSSSININMAGDVAAGIGAAIHGALSKKSKGGI